MSSHKNVTHFYVFGLIKFIIKLKMHDVLVIVNLFSINYMPIKCKFTENIN